MTVAEQLSLRVIRPQVPVDDRQLGVCKTLGAAIAECIRLSGSVDKAIAADTGIDTATLSRLKTDDAGIRGENLFLLMDACGNDFPLLWLLHKRGFDVASLRRRESELQKRLRDLEDENATLRHDREIEVRLLRDMKVGT